MKHFLIALIFSVTALVNTSLAQGEAGAIFLLISPGARAGGMGEAQTAIANHAYASYWNPAGLGFLEGTEVAMMHVNWLPNLAEDLYYDFFAFRRHIPFIGTLGGHIIYLNLGEQIRMGDHPDDYQGVFTSFMMATTVSYGSLLSEKSSFGLNAKISYQHLTEYGAGAEKGKGTSIDFGFDVGYLRKQFLIPDLDVAATITNIGPKVAFIDPAQADPQPTNLSLGINYRLIDTEYNKLSIVYDVNKMLVASYPNMDWDGDGYIGRYDKEGYENPNGEYNREGQQETHHTDPIYIAIFTSWIDDWLLGGDKDLSIDNRSADGIIGGYAWDDDINHDGSPNEGEMVRSGEIPGDEDWGRYNEYGQLEVGQAKKRTIKNEIDKLIHNIGLEYWYSEYFALRGGFYYDKTGKIANPTVGVGLRFGEYGFDFGYTSGEVGHPLTNTMRFSLNWAF